MEISKINNLKNFFKDLIKISDDEGYYLDINFFSTSEQRINVDQINVEIDKDQDKGIKLRLWDGEKFLEQATTSTNNIELTNLLKNLINLAKKNKNSLKEKFDLEVETQIIEKDFIPEIKIKELTLEEKVNKLQEFKTKILKLDKDIVNVRVVFASELEEHIFVNKYRNLYQEIPLNFFVMVAFVNTNDGVKMVYESFVSNDLEVFERAEKKFKDFENKIDNIKRSKKLKGGKYEVVLSPHLTGLLAHESFGHGMESDTMMRGRALASDWQGKKIGDDIVNIVDYPKINGKNGEFHFDHEGNLARKTYLVKNGIISEPMADLYSKSRLKLKSSSNSRFDSFDHKNYVRMSNTYFEAGENSVEDLISGVKEGIFISDSNGGMEDPKSWGVQIQGCFGQRISNGKLVDEFYDGFSFTGFLPDIVKGIIGLSSKVEIDGGGQCGKGHKEWVRVSEGGPYMRIKEVILG